MFKRVALLILALCLGSAMFTFPKVSAISGTQWQAGRIVDDAVFTNKNSMNVDQIQAFLNGKVGTGAYGTPGVCDTNGTKTSELGDGSRAQYGADHGNPAPFTCLKDYYEVPKTTPSPGMPANNYGGKPIPAGAESAAQLIWDAAQKYSINPQVLLVTIQKESVGPLTTDDWPLYSQYQHPLGANCPDSGPGGTANCDSNYYGLSIQLMQSAALLRYYLDNMNQSWWPYKKIGTNSIQYDVSTSCGSSNVNITTMATAALYTYTPYQPNKAALDNLYGTGDSCSAYGNRNFWRIFNDWFGNTVGADYQATITSQKLYSDAAHTQEIPEVAGKYILTPGQTVYATIEALNSGRATWNNFGNLGTAAPNDRTSVFQGTGWLAPQRPATLTSNPIAPGQTGTFNFNMKAPTTTGGYSESFGVVEDGQAWTNGVATFHIDVTVPNNSQLSPSTSTLISGTGTNSLYAGSTMLSPDGYTSLTLDANGNLVLRNDFVTVWSAPASAGPGSYLVMQGDGNLVLYSKSGTAVWNTQTSGKGASTLRVQEDGNLVVYNGSGATWNSGTGLPITHYNYTQNTLASGSTMYTGQKAQTADRKYTLVLQGDGNLVLYSPTRAIWATYTVGSGASSLSMQGDGNLVLYAKNGKPIWWSGTNGRGSSFLAVQQDGNLVTYNSVGATWNTGTVGKQ